MTVEYRVLGQLSPNKLPEPYVACVSEDVHEAIDMLVYEAPRLKELAPVTSWQMVRVFLNEIGEEQEEVIWSGWYNAKEPDGVTIANSLKEAARTLADSISQLAQELGDIAQANRKALNTAVLTR